jgi:hypothetical protein
MCEVLPLLTVRSFLPLLGLVVDSHFILIRLVTSSTCHSWLGEVHYLEYILLVLLASLDSEVKPLLMPTSVGVDLHKQVVGIWLGQGSLSLKQVTRLEDGVKPKMIVLLVVLHLVIVGHDVLT